MPLHAIEKLLKEKIGLHSATVGSSTVSHAVEQRMRDCGIEAIGDYEKLVSHSATELDALIDRVVIPETWFYRDGNPFAAFRDWVTSEWLPRQSATPLRVLSVPCSSGEEPYTLAMCLADCDIPENAAQIDAVDICGTSLEKASRAHYGSNSFRGSELRFRDRHFEPVGEHYELKHAIRTRVRFEQANILDSGFTENRAPYHVIFCRNLLIYFDRPTQQEAIDRLEKLLTHNGLLFLGHSETSLLLKRRFIALEHPRCFGFRHGQASEENGLTGGRGPVRRPAARRQINKPPGITPLPFADSAAQQARKSGSANAKPPGELLQQAFRLADEGHLDEAALRCESLLDDRTHQADAHYLLGLVREAAGNVGEAEQMFRKSVYLDPDHYEALTHLGVICKQKGDTAAAQRFQERARRAQQRCRTQEAQP